MLSQNSAFDLKNVEQSDSPETRVVVLKNGGGQNARATGGPGILPVTKWAHWLSRKSTNERRLPGTGQYV